MQTVMHFKITFEAILLPHSYKFIVSSDSCTIHWNVLSMHIFSRKRCLRLSLLDDRWGRCSLLMHTIVITILNTWIRSVPENLFRKCEKRARQGKIVPSSIIYGFDFDTGSGIFSGIPNIEPTNSLIRRPFFSYIIISASEIRSEINSSFIVESIQFRFCTHFFSYIESTIILFVHAVVVVVVCCVLRRCATCT